MQREDDLNTDHVADLAQASEGGVEYYPVLRARYQNRILDGRHRKAARKSWHEVVLPIDTELEFWRAKARLLIQRTPPDAERVDVFSHLGDELERAGLSNPEIMKQLRKASPYKSERYTYEQIPDRFKSGEGRPKGPSLLPKQSLQEGSTFEVDGEEVGVRGPGEELRPKHPVGPCPCCNPPKTIAYVRGRFKLADATT